VSHQKEETRLQAKLMCVFKGGEMKGDNKRSFSLTLTPTLTLTLTLTLTSVTLTVTGFRDDRQSGRDQVVKFFFVEPRVFATKKEANPSRAVLLVVRLSWKITGLVPVTTLPFGGPESCGAVLREVTQGYLTLSN